MGSALGKWDEAVKASDEPEELQATVIDGRHSITRHLDEVTERLVKVGFPDISEWWRETFARFYASGKRQLVLRVGRRGGKSSSLCRLGVVEALWGDHSIPPGDVGVVAVIAQDRKRAGELLGTVKKILEALEVEFKATADEIRLTGKDIVFRVVTASVKAVRGGTCICVICDEVCFWLDEDIGRNPATEVLAAVRPTMLTQPNAKIFLSSSPQGELDAHAKAFALGETDFQSVAFAPTWIAHPAATEEETHKLEPGEDVWRREYAAIPMEGTTESFLSASMLDRATRAVPGDLPKEKGVYYVAAMDPGYTRNPWTFVVACRRRVDGVTKKSVVAWRQWQGTARAPNDPEKVLAEVAELCRRYGCDGVESDQYERFALQTIAEKFQLHVFQRERGAGDRMGRYEALRTEFANGTVEIPSDPHMRSDLLGVRAKLTANGFSIDLPETPDGRHADFAPSIALAFSNCQQDPIPQRGQLTPEEVEQEIFRKIEQRSQQARQAPELDSYTGFR